MSPGDVVRCIDDRYSEGRLVNGRMYVVSEIEPDDGKDVLDCTPRVAMGRLGIRLVGCPSPSPKGETERGCDCWWKSSRFVPVNRKDLETEILAKVADKIMGGMK